MADTDPDPAGRRVDWEYLDDAVSALWLGALAIALLIGALTGMWLVITGNVRITGSVPARLVFMTVIAPIIVGVTLIALLDVYGKRRVRSAIELINQNR